MLKETIAQGGLESERGWESNDFNVSEAGMAGHGGMRPGAGAPRGGISQARRLLLRGLQRGLAHAGRAKGLAGDDEEVATESVAMIASDMVLAGQGRDVLAIWAQAAPKGDEGEEGGKKSPLLRALERMPGLGSVPNPSQLSRPVGENTAESKENAGSPTDPASVTGQGQPFFSPQGNLLPPAVLPPTPPPTPSKAASPRLGDLPSVIEPATQAGQAGGGGTPYPPSAPARQKHYLRTENLEKNLEDDA